MVTITIMHEAHAKLQASFVMTRDIRIQDGDAAMARHNKARDNAGLSNWQVQRLRGSSSIGLAVGHQVAAHEAHDVFASSSEQRIQQAVATLGVKTDGHTLDLCDIPSVESFFEKLADFERKRF